MEQELFNKKLTEHLVQTIERNAENKKKSVIQTAETIRDRMTRLIETLNENGNPNSLGELQGLGSELDRMIGELCVMHEIAKDLPSSVRYAKIMIDLYGE